MIGKSDKTAPKSAADKIALVTGASRGLGAAMAENVAARGYHVIALARTVGGLEELDDRIQAAGGTATLVPVDLTDEAALPQICASIYERWGHVDLLIHAAIHAPPLCPADHLDAKDLDKTIAANIRATSGVITNVSPLLAAAPERASAVFFDDSLCAQKFHGAYGLSKAAQITLARAWQAETRQTGPCVHILSPQPMPTALRARFYPGEARDELTSCQTEAERLLEEISL